jgi:hypothetical protein
VSLPALDLDGVREAELRLEAKIEASRTEITKWFVTSLFAQAAVIVALLKLLLP